MTNAIPFDTSKSYALLIGVGKRKADSAAMKLSADDAKFLGKALANLCKFDKNKIIVRTEKDASKTKVIQALESLAKETSKTNADLIVIYFSGHGEIEDGKSYFVCNNTSDDLGKTALEGSILLKKLHAIQADKMLVILDCCHAKGMIPTPFEEILLAHNKPNRVVLAACHSSELSYLSKPVSLFTYSLLEGLSGWDLKDDDRTVSLFDLALYTRERVKFLSGKLKLETSQTPQFNVLSNSSTSNFILARHPKGKPDKSLFKEKLSRLFRANKGEGTIPTKKGIEKDEEFRQQFNINNGVIIYKPTINIDNSKIYNGQVGDIINIAFGSATADALLKPLLGVTPNELIKPTVAKPSLYDLFELVTKPADVIRAIYQSEDETAMPPYTVDYNDSREDMPNVREKLELGLAESKGRLIIHGHHGIGKTREAAELARAACQRKWKVLIARTGRNPHMGQVSEVPEELVDTRILVVVDNLHVRIASDIDHPDLPTYIERLNSLIKQLDERITTGIDVIATLRDDSKYITLVENLKATALHGFGMFSLPNLTDKSLHNIFINLAAKMDVVIDVDPEQLVQNSDRMPETIFINIDIARQENRSITNDKWLPTEGVSWRKRFVSVRAEHPAIESLFVAMNLLSQFGIPARIPYVLSLTKLSGKMKAEIRVLVDLNLLRLRHGILSAYSIGQLKEIEIDSEALNSLNEKAEKVFRAIIKSKDLNMSNDLVLLSQVLFGEEQFAEADKVVSHVINSGSDNPQAYLLRSSIQYMLVNFEKALNDLKKAFDRGGKNKDSLFLSASINLLQGRYSIALKNADEALALGKNDASIYSLIGTAHYQQEEWGEAIAAFTQYVTHGGAQGEIFFCRGICKMKLMDFQGAEADFSEVLERGSDFERLASQITALQTGLSLKLFQDTEAKKVGNPFVYLLRAYARQNIGNFLGAIADCTEAINGDASATFNKLAEVTRNSKLPMLSTANKQLTSLPYSFDKGLLLCLRGQLWVKQNEPDKAIDDFNASHEAGFNYNELYLWRIQAYSLKRNFERVIDDTTYLLTTIGTNHAGMYYFRGLAYLEMLKGREAEDDAQRAIDLDPEQWSYYTLRGLSQGVQGKLNEAEADLTRSLEMDKNGGWSSYGRGCVRIHLGNFIGAEEDLTKAIELGFDKTKALAMRAQARLAMGKSQDANDDAEAALASNGNDMIALAVRGDIRRMTYSFESAISDYSKLIELGTNDGLIFFYRANALFELKQYAEAEKDYSNAAEMGFLDPVLFLNRGRSRSYQNNSLAAEQDFILAIESGRDDAAIHFYLAEALQNQGRFQKAETELSLAIERENISYYHGLRGDLRLKLGNFNGAESDFTEVLLDRDMVTAKHYNSRSVARYAQSKRTESLTDIEEAIKLMPTELSYLSLRLQIYLMLGQEENAMKDLAKLIEISRDSYQVTFSNGLINLFNEDFEKAFTLFKTASETDQSDKRWQALAMLPLGKYEEALALCKQVTTSTPGEILLFINELHFYKKRFADLFSSTEIESAVEKMEQICNDQLGLK